MQNNFFKALVIDDDPERNKHYLEVLSQHFSVDFINDVSKVTRRSPQGYDLLVMDICLSDLKTLTAFKLLNDHKWDIPIVMVSGYWLDSDGQPEDYILKVPQYRNIFKVVWWNWIEKKEKNQQIGEEIYYEFCKYRNIFCGNYREKFIILHLSDLQFGGDVSGSACNDNSRIASFLQDKGSIPDIIVITGDIADKGRKKEFDEAKTWIETLVKEMWGTDSVREPERRRIIIAPGNHDYDISACAADMFKFNFNSEKKDDFQEIAEEDRDFSIHQPRGFANFIDFAADFSGDDSWYHYLDKVVHTEDYFSGDGINLVTMNSVYGINSRNCENRFDGFYCDLSDISDNKLKVTNVGENSVNILVMHNPPDDFKNLDRNHRSHNKFRTVIEGGKIAICLYGHLHDDQYAKRYDDNGGKYCERLICVPAPSLRLAAASLTEDARRGFNVIELIKDGSIYNKAIVEHFGIKRADIYPIKRKEFDL